MANRDTSKSLLDYHPDMISYSDEDFKFIDNVRQIDGVEGSKLNMNVMVLCTAGRLTMDCGTIHIEMTRNDFVVYPPNITVRNMMVSTDFECKVLCITNKGIQIFMRPYLDIWNRAVYAESLKSRKLDDVEMEFAAKSYDLAKFCIRLPDKETRLKKQIIQNIVRSALTGICGMFLIEQDTDRGLTHGDNLFQKFLDILQNSPVKHNSNGYYADKLCITPKYLSNICKKYSGKTANEWIKAYTISDITYYLQETDCSIKEIASLTGFPNTSFFGKYVKQNLGATPRSFREMK